MGKRNIEIKVRLNRKEAELLNKHVKKKKQALTRSIPAPSDKRPGSPGRAAPGVLRFYAGAARHWEQLKPDRPESPCAGGDG